ncbi:hypothetical protein EUGRSUZ_H00876 [Eucalyptus grandis]|uniref:Uncharacterized protein n=2 Tax=Eucalyptus grandis TaxID=71139 RepID=A0ACC3JQ55_EUCGR|nr:hypothetical protein EUGRSUZ_H00876 [Eucalyptus grandis]
MASSIMSSLPNSPVPRFIFLAMLLIVAGFWGSGLLTTVLFASILLVLASSSLFFNLPKQKSVSVEEPVGATVYTSTPETRLPQMNGFEMEKEIPEDNGAFFVDEFSARSSTSADSLMESECIDPSCSSEDDCEIAIPTGHYVGGQKKREVHKLKKMPDSPYSVCEGNGPMDYFLSDEVSGIYYCEEENLIEIDISIGSIKCSRFQI